jgi:hypothetical protein
VSHEPSVIEVGLSLSWASLAASTGADMYMPAKTGAVSPATLRIEQLKSS